MHFEMVEEHGGVTITAHYTKRYILGVSFDDIRAYEDLRDTIRDMLKIAYEEGRRSVQEPIKKALGTGSQS